MIHVSLRTIIHFLVQSLLSGNFHFHVIFHLTSFLYKFDHPSNKIHHSLISNKLFGKKYRIFKVLSDILSPIFPHEDSCSMHLIVLPFTFICSIIVPNVNPFSINIIIDKISRVLRTIVPFENTGSLLQTVYVVTLEGSSVDPFLDTFSMLFI